MKKYISLFIVMSFFLTAFVGCDSGSSGIEFSVDGKSEYTFIRPTEWNNMEESLFSAFLDEMKERTGCKIRLDKDEITDDIEIDASAKEFLLGNTNRSESTALLEKLTDAGGNRFGISVNGNKIAVTGTSEYQMYLGLDYLLENLLAVDKNGNQILTCEDGYEYISEAVEKNEFEIEELVKSGKGLMFAVVECVLQLPSEGDFKILQGGTTDGTYAYIAMRNWASDQAVIYKYDLSAMELVEVSEPLPIYHANDFTYDSKNHRLVVSFAWDDWLGVGYIDPDTLTLTDSFDISIAFHALEYLPTTDQFVLYSGYDAVLTDENFNEISRFSDQNPQFVTQGIYSDERYVYALRSYCMVIHEMDGTYVDTVMIKGLPSEHEHIFEYNGDFYVGCYKPNALYHIKLVPKNWW